MNFERMPTTSFAVCLAEITFASTGIACALTFGSGHAPQSTFLNIRRRRFGVIPMGVHLQHYGLLHVTSIVCIHKKVENRYMQYMNNESNAEIHKSE
jgi:hypothetical protein